MNYANHPPVNHAVSQLAGASIGSCMTDRVPPPAPAPEGLCAQLVAVLSVLDRANRQAGRALVSLRGDYEVKACTQVGEAPRPTDLNSLVNIAFEEAMRLESKVDELRDRVGQA